MPNTPAGLVIFIDDKVYITARDWKEADGNPSADGGGIVPFEDAFATIEARQGFEQAVSSSIRLELKDVVGAMVITDRDIEDTPKSPALCAFRLTQGGPIFLARWLRDYGIAVGQRYSVFAVTKENDPLMASFQDALKKERNGESSSLTYDQFQSATLEPVFSSVTITKAIVADRGHSASDSAGDGGA
ncbi:MAG: hypothetical protein AAGB11_17005 [Pseudomonadota bacterium]